jgi:CheY-like chemotaxis protein
MIKSVLTGKRILAVADEPDVLEVLREELLPYGVELETAGSHENAIQMMHSATYDLVILDIMGVRGFELLEFAVFRGFPAVMLTAHDLTIESLRKAIDLGARAYLPKNQLANTAPFLEDVLTLSHQAAWKSLLTKLSGFFGQYFGREWRKTEQELLEKFGTDPEATKPSIIQ